MEGWLTLVVCVGRIFFICSEASCGLVVRCFVAIFLVTIECVWSATTTCERTACAFWVCVGDPLPILIFERSVPRFSAGSRQVWRRFGVTARRLTCAPLLAVPPPPRAHNRPTPTPGHRRQSSDSPFCSRDAQDGERVSARSDAGTSRSAILELGRRCLSLLVGRRTSQTELARPPVCVAARSARGAASARAVHARRAHAEERADAPRRGRGRSATRPSAVARRGSDPNKASATTERGRCDLLQIQKNSLHTSRQTRTSSSSSPHAPKSCQPAAIARERS